VQHRHFLTGRSAALVAAITALLLGQISAQAAGLEAQLLIEADSGKVLHAENATYPWHPASITKLMTAYVTLKAVREGRISFDTLLTVSANATAQSPSKMGFKPGTKLTVDNALKMMMVKSANDMAVVLAEGVSGSIDGFAADMNRAARRLGMTQTNYVNPNGLPDDAQVTSARDIAILARSFMQEMPEYDMYLHLPAIKFGKRVTRNFNGLIGRYPGADGIKTGFICASGYNLVGSATRGGRRLIAVVLGASSGAARTSEAAELLERGFSGPTVSWLTPSLGTVDALAAIEAAPVNLREEMCGKHRKRPATETSDGEEATVASTATPAEGMPEIPFTLSLTTTKPTTPIRGADLLSPPTTPTQVYEVYLGPARKQPTTQIADVSAAQAPAKPGQIAPGTPTVRRASAGAVPWTTFSSSALSITPPESVATTDSDEPGVPLPRPRPRLAGKR